MDASFLQAANSTADLTEYTFSSQNLGAADAGRYIVVCASARAATGIFTLSSITVGGVVASIVCQTTNAASGRNLAGIAIAAVPTGTTGDVVVTFSGTAVRSAIQMYRLVSIDDPTPTDTGTSVADAPTTTLDVSAGGVAIGVAFANGNTTTTWTGITEDSDAVVEGAAVYSSAHDVFEAEQVNLPVTATFAAGTIPVGAFASWAPGPAFLAAWSRGSNVLIGAGVAQ